MKKVADSDMSKHHANLDSIEEVYWANPRIKMLVNETKRTILEEHEKDQRVKVNALKTIDALAAKIKALESEKKKDGANKKLIDDKIATCQKKIDEFKLKTK